MNKFGPDNAFAYRSPTKVKKQIIISECQEDDLHLSSQSDLSLRLPQISSALSASTETRSRVSRS